jgi:hypothetical protein
MCKGKHSLKLSHHWLVTQRLLAFRQLVMWIVWRGVLFYGLYVKLDRKDNEMTMLDANAEDVACKRALEETATASGNNYEIEKSAA